MFNPTINEKHQHSVLLRKKRICFENVKVEKGKPESCEEVPQGVKLERRVGNT